MLIGSYIMKIVVQYSTHMDICSFANPLDNHTGGY